MLIGFTSEQSQLRDATRDLLAEVSSQDRVRALMPDPVGTDPDAWRELAGLGLPGIAVPERFGGEGGSLVDQGVVLEEMGRALCGGPYFSTAVLAAQTLLAAPDGDPVAAELLEGICAGGPDRHAGGHRGWRPVGRGGRHASGRPRPRPAGS